jgi:anti-sigma regulatory factor (Ser/Thr protein kinase)
MRTLRTPGGHQASFNIRQLTDVSHCKLQHHFLSNPRRAFQYMFEAPAGERTGPKRNLMNAMAPTRPTQLHSCRVQVTTGPKAAAEARGQVRGVIGAWEVPVDPNVAALLISELVTNAIKHETGDAITLVFSCSDSLLRVDVHDTSHSLPVQTVAPAESETGRGLLLVASLSQEWGFYRTPAGKAVYFTLAFQPEGGEHG